MCIRDSLYKLLSHHLRQNLAVLKILLDRAKTICELWFLNAALPHLEKVLQVNSFSVID